MGLTLLIDLDDTLLGNAMDTFLPAYIQGLGRCLAPYVDPGKMVQALLQAIRKMVENNQPNQTLQEIFEEHFYSLLDLPPKAFSQPIAQFYTQEFGKLRTLTQPRPEAVALVEYAIQRGDRVVVATNPLFPATAIHQRLEWAGLPPENFPFAYITTYESAHFAKPNPAYFAEILANLGWPEDPVIMIGDDWERDIRPAQKLGFSSFWIHENGAPPEQNTHSHTPSGSVGALIPYLQNLTVSPSAYNAPIPIDATLRSTPAALAGPLAALPSYVWHEKTTPEQWTLTETVCHMRDVEKNVNIPRIKQILNEDNPFLIGVDTDAWIETYHYDNEAGLEAFNTFVAYRLETLALLERLSEEDWQRPARHAIFGPTNFQEIAHFIAEHDRLHIRQIHPLIANEPQIT